MIRFLLFTFLYGCGCSKPHDYPCIECTVVVLWDNVEVDRKTIYWPYPNQELGTSVMTHCEGRETVITTYHNCKTT